MLIMLLYVLYTAPITDMIKYYDVQYHLWADDTQIYVTVSLSSQSKLEVQCVC